MRMGNEIFYFAFSLKKKTNNYALWYKLSLYYLNLFHAVHCISSIMSNVLMICIFRLYVVESFQERKKCMNEFLARTKSLLVRLRSSLSACPMILVLSASTRAVHTSHLLLVSSTISVTKLFPVLSIFCSADCSSETQRWEEELCLFCVVTVYGHAGYYCSF